VTEDLTSPAAETTPERPRQNRLWRMALIIVSFQLVFIALGMVFFTALGFANDPTGSCGGG
jgi:hypothetical protein